MERNDATGSRSSVLDARARSVVDQLHARARSQRGAVIRHYLPRLPGLMLGRPLELPKDKSFFDDKLISIDAAQGELLYMLARAKDVRGVVEFGTSFGVSTIYLAAAIRDAGRGGCVIGTELVGSKVLAARENLARAGLEAHVQVREGDARQTLRDLPDPVDMLLLDGWPSSALDVFEVVEPSFADGAIVVVDNVAQFPRELAPLMARLSRGPYRSTRLPLNRGTFVAVLDQKP